MSNQHLRLHDDEAESQRPSHKILASVQTDEAIAYLRADRSHAPKWCASALQTEFGVMLPGEVVVVGAPPKAGKTTFLLSQLEGFIAQRRRVLYFPLEMTPSEARLRLAAARLGFEWDLVAQGKWVELPDGAAEAMESALADLQRVHTVQFPEDGQATLGQVKGWVEWAIEEYRAEIVVVDHFHRLDFGTDQNYRLIATDAIRQLKNLAQDKQVVLIVAVQFNRSQDPMDLVMVHGHERFKETSALGEEAALALTLSRVISQDVSKEALSEVRKRQKSVFSICEPDTMRVHCAAIRRRDIAKVRDVLLHVQHGRIRDPHYGERGYRSTQPDLYRDEETEG